ncbi:MAG: crotonobetainyl-CoA:carnitine CoA-transferase CaiB-like acyl-CoA transferase [Gammaproteobacteria bacterium]|jgi:crotonobetainyl-CoA:carnitine CoA-transferase CaiB-like acyl-CoA transferase
MGKRNGPLSRFTVLDLCRVRSGPTAVRQLADWGADVIKIEAPESVDTGKGMGGARLGPDFQNLHRNKRAITLNLKSPEGVAVLKRLVEKADVLIENYRPDVKSRLGIDYEALKAVNPKLVYGSISGFGQDGPYAQRPGFDQIAQGMGGLMSITGVPGEGPMRVGVPIADLTAGMYTAMGVLTALLEREVSGQGQWVHTSLLEAQIAMLDFQAARWTMKQEVPGQAGNNHPTSIPTGVFTTRDGHINIATTGERMFVDLCNVLGIPEMATDERFSTSAARLQNREACNEGLQAHLHSKTSDEWVTALNDAGVPCGPIYNIDQVFADQQVKHLNMTRKVSHPQIGEFDIVRHCTTLSRAPNEPYTVTADRGEHTDEVLGELGYSADEISSLRNNGTV